MNENEVRAAGLNPAQFARNGTMLPTEMEAEDQMVLEKAGAVFHGVVPRRPILQFVTLPPGWALVPAGPWDSDLFDGQRRLRGCTFFKTPRSEYTPAMNLVPRFSIDDWSTYAAVLVKDTATPFTEGMKVIHCVHFTPPSPIPPTLGQWLRGKLRLDPPPSEPEPDLCGVARKEAESWLNREYPMWRDKGAYWDEK